MMQHLIPTIPKGYNFCYSIKNGPYYKELYCTNDNYTSNSSFQIITI